MTFVHNMHVNSTIFVCHISPPHLVVFLPVPHHRDSCLTLRKGPLAVAFFFFLAYALLQLLLLLPRILLLLSDGSALATTHGIHGHLTSS